MKTGQVTGAVPLRLELSESASLGDSYHVRRVRLNLMTLIHVLAAHSNMMHICIVQLYNVMYFIYHQGENITSERRMEQQIVNHASFLRLKTR